MVKITGYSSEAAAFLFSIYKPGNFLDEWLPANFQLKRLSFSRHKWHCLLQKVRTFGGVTCVSGSSNPIAAARILRCPGIFVTMALITFTLWEYYLYTTSIHPASSNLSKHSLSPGAEVPSVCRLLALKFEKNTWKIIYLCMSPSYGISGKARLVFSHRKAYIYEYSQRHQWWCYRWPTGTCRLFLPVI